MENDLEVPGAAELAKAIKDHERRREGRQVSYFFDPLAALDLTNLLASFQ